VNADEQFSGNPLMNTLHETFARVLWSSLLAIALGWLASEPDLLTGVERFHAGAKLNQPPVVTSQSVRQFSWSRDGQRLLFVSRGGENTNGRLGFYDAHRPGGCASIDVLGEPIGAATLAPDGLYALVATYCGHVAWIDLQSGKTDILIELSRSTGLIAVALSDDQRLFAAADWDGRVFLGDPNSGTSIVLTATGGSAVMHLDFSDDGKQLICARTDGVISVWDLMTGTRLCALTGHEGAATAAALLPDGIHVLSAGRDGTVRMWEATTGREVWRQQTESPGFIALAVTSDGTCAAWGGTDGIVVVWNLEHSRPEMTLRSPGQSIGHLEFSPDGRALSIAGNSGTIWNVDSASGAFLHRIPLDSTGR